MRRSRITPEQRLAHRAKAEKLSTPRPRTPPMITVTCPNCRHRGFARSDALTLICSHCGKFLGKP